jgi:hypothetical protein
MKFYTIARFIYGRTAYAYLCLTVIHENAQVWIQRLWKAIISGVDSFLINLAQLQILTSKVNIPADFTRKVRNHNYSETYPEHLSQISVIIVDQCGKC